MNRWTLTHGADLDCRFWGDECLVHHALSNDSHRLAAWAGLLLMAVDEQPEASSEVLAEQFELPATTIDDTLAALARLDLVRRC